MTRILIGIFFVIIMIIVAVGWWTFGFIAMLWIADHKKSGKSQ